MPSDKVVTGAGFKLIIRSGTVSKVIQKAAIEGLNEVAKQYFQSVIKNISLEDHTLEDLRNMGYPYRVDGPKDMIHGDDRMVHIQSGKLKDSIKLEPVSQDTSRKFTIHISSTDPIMPYLIYGTSKMRPRNFPQKAYEDIKDKYWKPLIKALSGINFRIGGYNGRN